MIVDTTFVCFPGTKNPQSLLKSNVLFQNCETTENRSRNYSLFKTNSNFVSQFMSLRESITLLKENLARSLKNQQSHPNESSHQMSFLGITQTQIDSVNDGDSSVSLHGPQNAPCVSLINHYVNGEDKDQTSWSTVAKRRCGYRRDLCYSMIRFSSRLSQRVHVDRPDG